MVPQQTEGLPEIDDRRIDRLLKVAPAGTTRDQVRAACQLADMGLLPDPAPHKENTNVPTE
jgi:hypothetical protein